MKINTNKLTWRKAFCLLFLLGLTACAGETPKETPPKIKATEGHLSLNKATLEQSNEKGQSLWKIEVVKAVYSPDRKKVQIENIKGNIFQDGQRVLEISSKEGEVYRDGEEIYLKNNIVAVDPRNGIRITADEMKWQPKQDLLTVTKKLKSTNKDLEITATEGRYHSRRQEIELIGKVFGIARQDKIELKTEYLKWLIGNNKIIGDRPLEFVRYLDKLVTDKLNAKRMEMDTKDNTVLAQDAVTFKSIQPSVQIAGKNFLWNYRDRHLESQQPLQVVDYKDQVTITANQGYFDQVKQYVNLKGGVHGQSPVNQAEIYAQEAIWHLDTKLVEGTGDISYKQINPPMYLTGDHAVGILQENRVIVTSNNDKKVVTVIDLNKKQN